MNFKTIIEEIDKVQRENLVSLKDFRSRGKGKGTEILPSRSRGLYWLWCKTSVEELSKTKKANGAHVPIERLLKYREGLDHICNVQEDQYTVLYNGMGGYTTWKKNSVYGLRGRINQEVNCSNTKTGTLNILGSNCEIEDWKVSFFDFDDKSNHTILKELAVDEKELDVANLYKKFANELEVLWRMHYGTPILCRY